MKIVLVLCVAALTITLVIMLIYLIRLIIRLIETVESMNYLMKRITPEVERILNTINSMMTMINTVKDFWEGINLRWAKGISIIIGFLKGLKFIRNIFKKNQETTNTQNTQNIR